MQCWACKGELIWGDIEDESGCPKCGAFVMVHHGSKDKYKELTEKDLKEWTKK